MFEPTSEQQDMMVATAAHWMTWDEKPGEAWRAKTLDRSLSRLARGVGHPNHVELRESITAYLRNHCEPKTGYLEAILAVCGGNS